jgi:probable HAF family extracellular repeat protein
MRRPNDQLVALSQMKAKTMKTNHDRRRQNPAIRTLKILANNAHTNARDVHFPQTPEDSFGVHLSYRHRTMRAVVCALWVLTTASCAHAAASLTLLTWLGGDNFNYNTTGVSGDGSVVVGTSGYDTSGYGYFYRAFRWTAGSGMVGVGGRDSSASGVSGDGSVVVGTIASNQAFRWTAGTGMVGLGYLPGYNDSLAAGVSADGSVVVGRSYSDSGNQAFRWTAGSGMVGLGYLPGGNSSSASGVSADGSVIVGTSGSQAFRWTAGSGMVGLGHLPGGTNNSVAGVSADGSVIVGTSSSASGVQAFRWTAGSGMVGLGYLPGGNSSSATAVSGDGSVVVGNGLGNDGYDEAFRWTAGSGMQSLWDVLVTNGLNFDPAEWLIASGISADGNTIVGSDYYSYSDFGLEYGFVATLPGLIGVSPALNINSWSSAAHHLVLSWSTNYSGCTLQSSTNLGSTNWTDCASPAVSGASFVVTNSMSAGAQFFRLKR